MKNHEGKVHVPVSGPETTVRNPPEAQQESQGLSQVPVMSPVKSCHKANVKIV